MGRRRRRKRREEAKHTWWEVISEAVSAAVEAILFR